ncbi:LPXTG-site transpeptidase (sortase) family protein [Thermocatellispora tengchongensis]|uniref:LPXTG-site transpeptidase (Sortase) family protein n=1 Tax=Thermocatellispora tengchongensis TaxID=1073253 RepID=A0A840PNX5_9ACTN|nr:class F sortase [Thermocatellispora tengchongensis]MBB5139400.1 LPXTG-site transpeptidase (sortase) family protein [Thermocatellispora tengchongensis]
MAESTRWTRIVAAGVITGLVLFAFRPGEKDEETAEPERSSVVPRSLDIPALDLDAPLMKLGMTDDGEVELPPYDKPSTAGWFEHSAVPGDGGASVIIGHVDTKTAPAVFYKLRQLRKGQKILVERSDGKVAEYQVDAVEQVHKDSFPARRVYVEDGLKLVTCGGAFDWKEHEYRDNVIVYASLVAPTRHA